MLNEIPLVAESHTLSITLSNKLYKFGFVWRDTCYVMDIKTSTSEPIARGIPLVTSDDLLTQLSYLGIGSLELVSDTDALDPIYTNLGLTKHLVYHG